MLLKKVFVNTTPVLSQLIINIVSVPLFVGILGENKYGVYLLFVSIIAGLSIFQIGIPKIVIRGIAGAKNKGDYSGILLNGTISSLITACFGSAVLLFVELLFGIFLKSYPDIPFWFLVAFSPVYYAFSIISSYLIGRERYKTNGYLLIIINTTSVVMALCLAWLKVDLTYIIICSWSVKLFIFVLFWILEFKELRLNSNLEFNLLKDNRSTSLWISFGMISSVLIIHFDQIIISSIGIASLMTIYKVIITPYDVLQNISRGVLGVTLPRISKASIKGPRVRFKYVLLLQKRISFFLYSLSLVAAIMSKSFIKFWMPQYSDFSEMTVILCLFFGLVSSSAVFYNFFISIDRLKTVSIFQLVLAMVNVSIGYLTTDIFSWKSVIYANFLTFSISFYCFAYYYFYIEKSIRFFKNWLLLNFKYLFIATFAFFLSTIISLSNIFSFLAVSFVISIIVLLLLDLLLYNLKTTVFALRKSGLFKNKRTC
ncbi:MAG: oligosaccharide flippase family protein [Cyclobacteriaceae bacterium]